MMCGNCQKHVNDTLRGIEGVQDVDVSLTQETAVVHFDENQVSEQAFYKIFEDSNYTITAQTTS